MTSSRRILVVLGTRPEAVKLAPVIEALRRAAGLEVSVCLTGQHREMARQILSFFGVAVDVDLDIMRAEQGLTDITVATLTRLGEQLERARPAWVVVQGDTTTAFAAALAAFYRQVRVAHVEAGLRTGLPYAPYPEEMNRALIGRIAALHFAPTAAARLNLLREGVAEGTIEVTGNPGIDALVATLARLEEPEVEAAARASLPRFDERKPLILVTAHRRESLGEPLRQLCHGLRALAENESVVTMMPVHPRPEVRETVAEILHGAPGVHLLEPVSYPTAVWLEARCRFIITDSGGIQEEAAALGKPVIVTREVTERGESVTCGVSQLVGVAPETIVSAARTLLHDEAAYQRMARRLILYGDGHASARIVARLLREPA